MFECICARKCIIYEKEALIIINTKRSLNEYKCKGILEMLIGLLLTFAVFGLSFASLTVTLAFILCSALIIDIK